jgi:hypothetical protein
VALKKGTHLSDAHKKSISQGKKGKSNGRLGTKHSDATKQKMKDKATGNTNATGLMKDVVSYREAHAWARKNMPKPEACKCCGSYKCPICGKHGIVHRCNIDHKYRRVLEDWFLACPECHRKIDKKNKLIKTRWDKQ